MNPARSYGVEWLRSTYDSIKKQLPPFLPKFSTNNSVIINGKKYPKNSTVLDLRNNQITDIGPLADLTNLKELSLRNSQIVNIDALKSLVNLKKLNLSINKIDDIGPLADLTNLEYLDLSNNPIVNIAPLANLKNLKTLYLNYTRIDENPALWDVIDTLGENNPNIRIFGVNHIKRPQENSGFFPQGYTEDTSTVIINGKKYPKNSTVLDLRNNQITDIGPLADLTNLEGLDLSNNPIKDIAPLENLKKLKYLFLNGTRIPNNRDSWGVIERIKQNNPDIKIYGVDHIKRPQENSGIRIYDGSSMKEVEEEKNWASFILVKGALQEVKEITYNSQSNDFAKRSTLWLKAKTRGTQSFNDVIKEILGAINNDKKLDENIKNVAQFALLGGYRPQYRRLFGIDASQYNLKIKDFKIDSNWGGVFGQQNITMSGTDSDLQDVVVRLWELCQKEPDPFKKKVLIDSFITGLSNMYDEDGLHCRDRFQDVILAVLSNIDEAPKYAKGVTLLQLFEPLEKRRLAEYNALSDDHIIKKIYEKLIDPSTPSGNDTKDPLYLWVPSKSLKKFNALNKEEKKTLDRYRKEHIADAWYEAYKHKEKDLTNEEVEAITNYINQLIVTDFL
jgi:Leucine-rich repeat (LRR) protein